MKQKMPAFAALFAAALTIWAACTRPTPFGSELLDDELAEYEFTDTLTVECTIELEEDSLVTSDLNSTATAFLCGELNDPIFGKSQAEIFSLMQLSILDPGFDPADGGIDSLVLYLRYVPTNVYGDTLQPQSLRVYRLDSLLDNGGTYYTNSSLPATVEIGRLDNFMPRPFSADSLVDPATKAAFLRVPMSLDFANELFNLDTLILENDSAFIKAFRGIKIVATGAGANPGAMLAFDLNNESYSRMRLYYYENADSGKVKKTYSFFFAGVNKFSRLTHDYAGSQAGQQIGQISDDLLYVQAMQGLRVKVEIPYVDKLEDIAVNKAQLVLTTATLPNDNPRLTSTNQLVFTERRDTTFVFTSDVLYSLGPSLSSGFSRFGGFPVKENVNGTLVERYRLTLTQRLQGMVDDTSGDIQNKTLYINVSPQIRIAQRSVFYGPKSATFPAKLEIKYTRVQ